MLVTNVEVWPGGDIRRRRVVTMLQIVNESNLASDSDYTYNFTDPYRTLATNDKLIHHIREDGAWELIRKVLNDTHERGLILL